jgi:FKBP-type peptidyl-prolyl cis-trans isomerase
VAGDTVTVNYVGAFMDGTVFDNSYTRGTPFTFQLGSGQVIQGFDQGILGMKVGGKRLLVIPSSLAYGSQGNSVIPPNTPIQFQVELVSIAGK